jgi:hypothetical protein
MNSQETEPASETDGESTFASIFCNPDANYKIIVPDYQRAYSWEETQIKLFIDDLKKFQKSGQAYYYGHFIAERIKNDWALVDGQQRMTTFFLFLLICRHHSKEPIQPAAESIIQRFVTVSYDKDVLEEVIENLSPCLNRHDLNSYRDKPKTDDLEKIFFVKKSLTRSLKRILLALLQFDRSFRKEELEAKNVQSYIQVVMNALCSHHITKHKSVAVNIFEMHNTRGVALTTLEKVKALLMRFVFENGETKEIQQEKVTEIQKQFGEIYRMEEELAARSFRGEMSMDKLLTLHLRVIDDGSKKEASEFHSPPSNSDGNAIIAYIEKRLQYADAKNEIRKSKADSVDYAIKLANELRKSVWIVSHHLYEWDQSQRLVGDVLILEPALSCEFFLLVCRELKESENLDNGKIELETLKLWERLLFTRDFHSGYHNLKTGRDDFPTLFASIGNTEESVVEVINKYLENGFRPGDRTKDLQSMVAAYVRVNESKILNDAFYFWKAKMIYVIYKYEISLNAEIRDVMKGKISVEHILPQGWEWDWIEGSGQFNDEKKAEWLQSVGAFINGIGNLLLITPGENSSASNNHPADKIYQRYKGGSYAEHNLNRLEWRCAENWAQLVHDRGKRIYKFMVSKLVASSEKTQNLLIDQDHA